jgi:hypothetical protein
MTAPEFSSEPYPKRGVTRRVFFYSTAATLLVAAEQPGHELHSADMRLDLHASTDAVYVASLALNREAGWPGQGFSRNLLPAKAEGALLRSGTAIQVAGSGWHGSRMAHPSTITSGPGRLRVEGVLLGPAERPLATEEWTIELDASGLRWQITRTFLEDCRLTADRFPALVFWTQAANETYSEIPGFLDDQMKLDGIKGFPVDVKAQWYEVISSRREQNIHFAPSNLNAKIRLSTGGFNYAKAVADGTASAVTLGAESVNRLHASEPRSRGQVQTQDWSFSLTPVSDGGLDVHLPDADLNTQLISFAGVYNQWLGWIYGNNPASTPCLHEMGWFPLIHGIQRSNSELQRVSEHELEFFARTGVEPNGYVYPRWWIEGYYKVPWGNLHDQIPHFILAVYQQAINNGNRDFIRSLMPVVLRVARYMNALDSDGDGVVEIPDTTGLANGKRECSNWYDIIKFGWKDAYINVQCVAALEAVAELGAWLGDAALASEYRGRHKRAADAHNRVFWNDQQSLYSDWIDVNGERRNYFYTDHNLMAVTYGVAGPDRSQRILRNLDDNYARLCREFKLPREAIYATPANMRPVARLGDMVDFGKRSNQAVFPAYENGCSFFHSTGFEIAARAAAGDGVGAYQTFQRVMQFGYSRNRLWGAALQWDTGTLVSEPLCSSLLIAWGFLRGCFNAWPTLDGIRISGNAPAQMEGARYTFCHLGRDVTLEVRNGITRQEENRIP